MPVFDDRERAHMADVRSVVLTFYAVVAARAAALPRSWVPRRVTGLAWFWRAVGTARSSWQSGRSRSASAFLLFFDTAFTIFHQVFFAEGLWTFDPATDRLVQLFPYQFWTDTSVAIAVVGFGLTIAVWALAAHRLAGRSGSPAGRALAVRHRGGARRHRWTDDVSARLRRSIGPAPCPALWAAGLVLIVLGNALAGFALVMAGWFARVAARASRRRDELERLIDGVTVGEVMETEVFVVAPQATLDTFADSLDVQGAPPRWPG